MTNWQTQFNSGEIVYRDDSGMVICGDCLDVMKDWPDKCVNLVVTSPPYNKTGYRGGNEDKSKTIGKYYRWGKSKIDYDSYEDNVPENEYQAWQIDVLNLCYKLLKFNGSFFYNHKIRRYDNKASSPFSWCEKSLLFFYQQIIWNRQGSCDNNINYCTPITELVLWLTAGIPIVYKEQANYKTEIWTFPPDCNNSHPAPYPLPMPTNCILLTTKPDDIILDPFMGSGTTCVAAKKLGRRYIGIDISREYCEIAKQRLIACETGVPVKEQRQGQKALFEVKQ